MDAVGCAIQIQKALIDRNAGVPSNKQILFRVGIHVGDIVEESDGDLMGDGVNIAARLEAVSEPNGLCLSGAAYEHVRDRLKEPFVDLGEKTLKNIARPVRVYALKMGIHRPRAPPLRPGNIRSAAPLPCRPCPSPTSAGIPNRTISSTASPRA